MSLEGGRELKAHDLNFYLRIVVVCSENFSHPFLLTNEVRGYYDTHYIVFFHRSHLSCDCEIGKSWILYVIHIKIRSQRSPCRGSCNN